MADDEALAGTSASSGCVAPDVAEAALERVLTSRTFAGTPVLQRLLRHLVRSAMRGEPPGATKEYVLGVEVFNRDSTFDPRTDTIVRAHARRLRTRLNEYYQTEGRDDPVRIDLPKGSYVAIFRERDACVCGESQSAVHPTAFTAPSTMCVSERPESQALNSVSHPVPLTAPSTTLRSTPHSPRAAEKVPEMAVASYSSST